MADQLNLDGYSLAEMQTLDTQLSDAIEARLTGNNGADDAADSFSTQGRSMSRTPLTELFRMRAEVKNAIAKKTNEPNGIGEILAQFGDA